MIDEAKAREKVETLNKQNLQNLLMAMAVEKSLFDIFGTSLDSGYSPETGTMLLRYKDTRSNALKNLIESVKLAVHAMPSNVRYFGAKETTSTSGARMEFTGGFSVMAIQDSI
jgi:hypothetical protein